MRLRLSNILVICMLLFANLFVIEVMYGQSDEERIRKIRNESNQALAALDIERNFDYLVDEVMITTGAGSLICGKPALREYIDQFEANKLYWIRTPEEVRVNKETGLAWETGFWKGYDQERGSESYVGGRYSAMWTKASGTWLIKSQLFVTLIESSN